MDDHQGAEVYTTRTKRINLALTFAAITVVVLSLNALIIAMR